MCLRVCIMYLNVCVSRQVHGTILLLLRGLAGASRRKRHRCDRQVTTLTLKVLITRNDVFQLS